MLGQLKTEYNRFPKGTAKILRGFKLCPNIFPLGIFVLGGKRGKVEGIFPSPWMELSKVRSGMSRNPDKIRLSGHFCNTNIDFIPPLFLGEIQPISINA